MDALEGLSAFGIGGIVIADHETDSWVKQSEFPKLLDIAVNDLGVTYIDTARGYDLAEATIGTWFKSQPNPLREKIKIGTKVSISRLKHADDLNSHFAASLSTSLQALGLKSVALHAPNPIQSRSPCRMSSIF